MNGTSRQEKTSCLTRDRRGFSPGKERGTVIENVMQRKAFYLRGERRRGSCEEVIRSGGLEKTSDSQNDDDDDDDESSDLKSQCPKLHKYSNSSPSIPISDTVCLIKKRTRYYTILNFSHFLSACLSSNALAGYVSVRCQ